MKQVLVIILTISLFGCRSSDKKPAIEAEHHINTAAISSEIISVKADIIARDESIPLKFSNAKSDEYFIVISLTNTQDTTVNIIIMSCSWSESFVFDNASFYLYFPGCDKNFPTTIEIAPHQSVRFFGKLSCSKGKEDAQHPSSFKIGFVDLPYGDFFSWRDSEKVKSKYKTYWSDTIYLESKLYRYEEEKAVK